MLCGIYCEREQVTEQVKCVLLSTIIFVDPILNGRSESNVCMSSSTIPLCTRNDWQLSSYIATAHIMKGPDVLYQPTGKII